MPVAAFFQELQLRFQYRQEVAIIVCHWRVLVSVVEVHAERTRGPVHNQFGMFTPKGFGHMATPADGPVCPQRSLQVFGRDLIPLDSLSFFIQQGGRVIVPVDFAERLVAIHAFLSLIPPVDDRPNEAGLWRFLDLCQTFLPAGFPFGPTRALAQPELWSVNS